MQVQLEPTYYATIYAGLKEGYDGKTHTIQEVNDFVHACCDSIGLCVTITSTDFIYVNGGEPGVVIGLINYPRFPDTPSEIKRKAIVIETGLLGILGQLGISIVCQDETIMITQREEAE